MPRQRVGPNVHGRSSDPLHLRQTYYPSSRGNSGSWVVPVIAFAVFLAVGLGLAYLLVHAASIFLGVFALVALVAGAAFLGKYIYDACVKKQETLLPAASGAHTPSSTYTTASNPHQTPVVGGLPILKPPPPPSVNPAWVAKQME